MVKSLTVTHLTNGTIKFYYVGPSGRHTEVYVEDELVRGYFFTNTSIMLLLWCVCDIYGKDVVEILSNPYDRVESEYTDRILLEMNDRSLMSKYDVVYDSKAIVNAYLFIKDLDLKDPLGSLLDIHDKFIKYIKIHYKIDKLEISYELKENEIYDGARV